MPSFGGNGNVHVKVSTSADTDGIDKTRRSLDDLDGASSRSGRSAAVLGAAVRASVAGIAAMGAATAAATVTGFSFNSAVEQAQAQIMAFTKDAGKTASILAYVKEEAAKTQFSFTDMASAAAGLIPASKMSGIALEELIREAEILAALNPAEGLVGAAFSLKEALSGDFVSIVERFNLPRKRLNELKEQGVPAIEAIRIAMREMGIDYDLVSKQGQTTAARWDTIKDQFTQLSGTLTKPLFDRVSKELGEFAANLDTANIANRFFEIMGRIKEVAKQVAEYLVPKLRELKEAIDKDVIPKLELLKPYLDDIARIFGVVVVGAIGLLIDTMKNLIVWGDNVIDWMRRNDEWATLLGVAFGTLATAMAMTAGFNAITAGFAFLTGVTLPGVMLKIAAFQALIAAPLVMPAIAVAAAIGSMLLVKQAAEDAHNAINNAKLAAANLSVSQQAARRQLEGLAKNGTPEQKARANKALGSGIYNGYANGGFTGRGNVNEVAGVVHKGEYVVPKSQVDQATGRPKAQAGGGDIVIHFHGNVNMRDEAEVQNTGRILARQLSAARAGGF